MKSVRDTTLVFATIDRPHAVQRFVHSIRAFYPELPICVADQTAPTAYMRDFYAKHGVDVLWVPHDTGVGACRNILVENTSTPLVFMCDDDLIFTRDTDFTACFEILDKDPEIGIIGGQWLDKIANRPEVLRPWAIFLELNRERKTLTGIPGYHYFPQVRHVGIHKYFLCDTALNFSFIRRDVFKNEKIRWDARFTCNGEHEDFYLNFKTASEYKVAFYPGLICRHRRPPAPRYERLRERAAGWRLFMEKWGVEQYLELDNGVRLASEPGKVHYQRDWAQYFASVGVVGEEEWDDPRFSNSLTDDMQLVLAKHFERKSGVPVRSKRPRSSLYLDPSGKLLSAGGEADVVEPEKQRALARSRLIAAGKHLEFHFRAPAAVRASDELFLQVEVTNRGESTVAVGPSSEFEATFRCKFERGGEIVAIDDEATSCFADLVPGKVHEQLVWVRAPSAPGIYELSVRLTTGGNLFIGGGAAGPLLVLPRLPRGEKEAPDSAILVDDPPPQGAPDAPLARIEWVKRSVTATLLARVDAGGLQTVLVVAFECGGEERGITDVQLTHHIKDERGEYADWDVSRQRIRLRPGRQVRAVVVRRSPDPRATIEVAAVVAGEGYALLFRAPPTSELRDTAKGRMLSAP